jgi:2-haloacid dehalogenase
MTVVIFDVGGVLIDWNPRHLYRKLFAGDDEAMERFLAEICTPGWNHLQDAGRSWWEGTRELIARWPQHATLIEAFDSRWEEMVPQALDDTIALAAALSRRGIPLFCLTNFSAEKFPLVRRRFDVFDLFDGIVVSGEIGVAKPDPAIFCHLLDRFMLSPRDCFFIDDAPANVAAARALGMSAHLFETAGGLADALRRRRLL